MANYVGAPLARLIRERAYTVGALAKADNRLQAKRLEYREAISERQRMAARIAELDQQIQRHRLDPSEIRAITAAPRTSGLQHGKFMRELVAVLRQAEGAMTTREIVSHMLATFNFPYNTPTERERVRVRITKRLGEMSAKGSVQRLHDPANNQEGIWMWGGL